MSLDDAVNLVLFAFKNGKQGDMFIHKAPASTIHDLAKTLIEIFKSASSTKIIGTRHGEKLYETLCTREEMSKAISMDNYFKIPIDDRDLNYDKYYEEGDNEIQKYEDYNSHNTYRLSNVELEKMLLNLECVKNSI